MLCIDCAKIRIPHSEDHGSIRIRRYDNFTQLKSLSRGCDFCSLIKNDIGDLELESFEYCRRLWGESLYQNGLKVTPIDVFFVAQPGCNITWNFNINVSNLDGYKNGPVGGVDSGYLGGLFFDDYTNPSRIASIPKSRRIEHDPSAEQMMRLASTWYNRCRKGHANCGTTLEEANVLPSRVLEIFTRINGSIGVRLLSPPRGCQESYVAISYCWGNSSTINLTKASIEEFADASISIEDLPATFQDAILLTRFVGIRYIWIDALCIIQDSPEDWDEQSASMFDVFSRATLVIGAASGKDSQRGLFDTKRRAEMGEAELIFSLPDGSAAKCFTRTRLKVEEPLHTRAWAFQEQVLAKRYLSFDTMQMQWNCRQDHFDEAGNPVSELCVPSFATPVRQRIDPTAGNIDEGLRDGQGDSAFATWQYIVRQYCKRYLTLPKDKLTALAGLAQHFAKHSIDINTDKYLAGLWFSQLPWALLWTTGRVTGQRGQSVEEYRAPTWSWASIEYGRISWLHCPPGHQTFTTVHQSEVHLLGRNAYGQITDAKLIVEGPVKRDVLLPDATYGDQVELWDEVSMDNFGSPIPGTKGARLAHVYFDLGDQYPLIHKTKYVHCLRITKQAGLAIEPHGEEGDDVGQVWRRTGVIEFFDDSSEWWHGAQTIRLTLI